MSKKETKKRGRPSREDSLKKTPADYKTIHINITESQAAAMIEMGGPKKFFDTLYYFWYRNFGLFEDQQTKERQFLKRVKRMSK